MPVHIIISLLSAMVLLSSCQDRKEPSPPQVIQPSTAHQFAKEKTVVVPPEVTRAWKTVRIAVIDKSRATENIYSVPIGGSVQIPSSHLMIYVEALLPSFVMEGTTMTSSSNELNNPGVKVRITDKGTIIFKGWLFSKYPNTHAFMHPKFGFTLVDVLPHSK